MNKKEFVDRVVANSGFKRKDVEANLAAILNTLEECLLEEEAVVQFIGFGTFKQVVRPEKTGTHPVTKKPITIPEKKAIQFKLSANLREKMNEKE